MALTPQEQAELQQLEAEQAELTSQFNNIKAQLAPPAEEAPQEQPVETSMLEAGARGAAQGVSMGFADEITAGAESLLTDKTYDKALEESRAEYKKSEEEYPGTTLAGEMAGGVGAAIGASLLAPGAGTAVAGGRLANLTRAARGLPKALMSPKTGVSRLANIAKAAGSGAAVGAATGAGKSEGDLKQVGKDTLSGAASGAVLGGILGGVVEGLGAAGDKISKAIDADKMPYSFKMIRDAWKQGKEGQGFVTTGAKKQITNEFLDASEQVANKMKGTMDEMRGLKDTILSNIDDKVNINTIVEDANSKLLALADDGIADAEPLLKVLTKSVGNRLDGEGNISVTGANNLVKVLESSIKKDYSANTKVVMRDAINNLKGVIRDSVPDVKAYNILKEKNPELLPLYEKYMSANSPYKIPEEVLEGAEQVVGDSPLAKLDASMHGLLNASEMLGDIVSKKGKAGSVKQAFKILDNMRSQTADTSAGEKAYLLYEKALEELKHAYKPLGEEIEQITKKPIEKLEVRKFLEGAKLGDSAKETAIVKQIGAVPAQLTASVANVAGQAKKASDASTSVLGWTRPATQTLSIAKRRLGEASAKNPNNGVFKFLNEQIDTALAAKDENRRAAIMNTLMQYEVFRNMFKDDKQE